MTFPFSFWKSSSAPAPAIAFDPAATNTNVTLSSSDRVATRTTGGGNGGVARALGAKSTGQWYVEFVASAPLPFDEACGLVLSGFNPLSSIYLGSNTTGWAYWNSGNRFFNGVSTGGYASYGGSDVIGVAWDADAGKLFFAKNNTWQGSSDPVAGTNAAYTSVTGTGYPAADVYANSAAMTIRRPVDFSYSPPTGYTGWTL